LSDELVVEVIDLVKDYGDFHAVKDISFDVHRGEVFGLLGENGAGKTTTLEIIEGLRDKTSGTTRVFGLDSPKNIQEIRERIGVQLQSSAYFKDLTLFEILDLFGSFYGKHLEPMDLLEIVMLETKAKSRVGELSGGQAQRFSLVASLVNDPELVFFDEPTTGLDPLARQNIWELIKRVSADGKTVILTSHYLEEVESLCERVAILKQGELIALDSVSSLVMGLEDPIRIDFLPAGQLAAGVNEELGRLGRLESSRARAGEFTLYLKDEGALRQLGGVDTDRMTVSTANLEDVFVKLTGETIKIGGEG
jgi:ABC-2 type transport system ATP-binding protein